MLGPISLILVVTLSILITRVAAIALVHTGVSRELARFQARSAFTGAGFTTEESERIVNHPVRRRIIMWLMFLGNAGIVTGITSLIFTFVGREGDLAFWVKIAALVLGMAVLWLVSTSAWVDRHLSNLVSHWLARHTDLNVRDYASLMHLSGDYRLVDMQVEENDWLAGQTLGDSCIGEEGLVVLAIHRSDETFLGTPQADTRLAPGDRLVIYGRVEALQQLDERRRGSSGDMAHEEAVAEQEEVVEAQERRDREADGDSG
ncbi:MAG: TrkA C-terminal domain-containing protein [Gammaproteobacteria bacterium]